jgi:hypothetical protein
MKEDESSGISVNAVNALVAFETFCSPHVWTKSPEAFARVSSTYFANDASGQLAPGPEAHPGIATGASLTCMQVPASANPRSQCPPRPRLEDDGGVKCHVP